MCVVCVAICDGEYTFSWRYQLEEFLCFLRESCWYLFQHQPYIFVRNTWSELECHLSVMLSFCHFGILVAINLVHRAVCVQFFVPKYQLCSCDIWVSTFILYTSTAGGVQVVVATVIIIICHKRTSHIYISTCTDLEWCLHKAYFEAPVTD